MYKRIILKLSGETLAPEKFSESNASHCFDAARVAAQVVSGIGFIGAGVIIFQKNVVRGITTAAGLWVAAAIGLACGAAMYSVAIAATLMTVLVLETMHFITRIYGEKELRVSLSPIGNEELKTIVDTLKNKGADIESVSLADGEGVFEIKIKQKDYATTVDTVLSFSKGFKVKIS